MDSFADFAVWAQFKLFLRPELFAQFIAIVEKSPTLVNEITNYASQRFIGSLDGPPIVLDPQSLAGDTGNIGTNAIPVNLTLRRVRFGVKSEQFDVGQKRLFEEAIDEDLAAMEAELKKLRKPAPPTDKEPPKRKPLPDNLPRNGVRLEPDSTTCQCGCQMKRIGGQLYGIEAEIKNLPPERRRDERRTRAAPIASALREWLIGQRAKITNGTATAKAIDYSVNRWVALVRYIDDPALPIDNNHNEQQVRPWATGRKNWLFAGSLLAGQRAAAIMSLIQSAKLNGHDPYAYLKDILHRLPTQKASAVDEILPHLWQRSGD